MRINRRASRVRSVAQAAVWTCPRKWSSVPLTGRVACWVPARRLKFVRTWVPQLSSWKSLWRRLRSCPRNSHKPHQAMNRVS
jgi:hypothetical protein